MHNIIMIINPRQNPTTTPTIRETVSKFCMTSCIVGTTDGFVVDGHICCIIKVIDFLSSNSVKVKELLWLHHIALCITF